MTVALDWWAPEGKDLDVSCLFGIVDNDNALVSLEYALALGRELAVGDYPIFLSANAHIRTPIR